MYLTHHGVRRRPDVRSYGGSGFQKQQGPVDLPKPHPSQTLLESFTAKDASFNHEKAASYKIENCSFVASYNWLEQSQPTILVPGLPPKWLPPANSPRLAEDSGDYHRDPNGARYPRYPTEPAVRAIFQMNKDFDTSKIDIVGCGSTMGSLLTFAKGEDRTFRFGVHRMGNTLFLVRKTNTPQELIEDVRGYGHSFPEAYTTWDSTVRGSASHQRIIRYDFGGLCCLIRSECDGYLPTKAPTPLKSTTSSPSVPHFATTIEDATAHLGLAKPAQKWSPTMTLQVREAGAFPIPQSAIFDLKTRSARSRTTLKMDDFLPRLWANQTPNFILAYHQRGSFNSADVNVVDVRADVRAWEARSQLVLSAMRAVLGWLIAFSKKVGHARFEVRRTGKGTLEVWSEVKGWAALSDEWIERWGGLEGLNEKKDVGGVSLDSDEDSDDEDYLKF